MSRVVERSLASLEESIHSLRAKACFAQENDPEMYRVEALREAFEAVYCWITCRENQAMPRV